MTYPIVKSSAETSMSAVAELAEAAAALERSYRFEGPDASAALVRVDHEAMLRLVAALAAMGD